MSNSSLEVRSRVWINDKKGIFLGKGRVNLLQAIEQYGSINKAAKSMNMSYLKAWKLVESMNIASKKPLTIKVSGGKGGGGTQLTEEGKKAIKLFQELNSRCQQFMDAEFEKLIKAYS